MLTFLVLGSVAAFVVGYYTTVVSSNVRIALMLHRWVGLLSDRVYRGLLLLSGLILAVYGLLLLDRGARSITSSE